MVFFLNRIDIRITLIVLLSFVLALSLTRFLVIINVRKRRIHNDEEDNVSAIIVDNMVNFETVKLFSQEEKKVGRLGDAFIPWLKTAWAYVNTFRVIDLSMGTLIDLSMFVLIYVGLLLSKEKLLSLGDSVLILGFIQTSRIPRLFYSGDEAKQ